MKRSLLVVVLVVVLVFAFAASAFATTGKFFKGGVDYYTWTNPTGSPSPGLTWIASGVSTVGSNTVQPGAHANYLATTAKCGMCHSVHRAAGSGVKLLPTADATCAGCHTGGTAITAKIITWGVTNMAWRDGNGQPAYSYGGAGPHNDALDTLFDDGEWDGISTPPSPSFELEPFSRYGCATRRCHATNPHGANSSKYKIFAAKLLFNNSPAMDASDAGTTTVGSYGGDDAVYDALGATDASVQRFIDANPTLIRAALTATAGVEINKGGTGWRAPDANETHALVSGLTCGRPSVGDDEIGNDECHAEASYAIFDKAVKENRNHATKISGNDGTGPAPMIEVEVDGSLETTINKNAYRTDNTGAEYNADGVWYSGGNGNRDSKTGHVAGTFAAVGADGSYAPIAGCTSCHDQTDSANTVAGKFTFPHGQTPVGTTNATAVNGTTGTMVRSRIWSGWSGSTTDTKKVTDSTTKAYDGQCLKCHRDGAGNGIGLTK